MKIGILSLQGNFAAHAKCIQKLGCEPIFLRKRTDFQNIQGLILPGGESTALLKLIDKGNLRSTFDEIHQQKIPIMATCAGLILLAEKVTNPSQESLELLPVEVSRNSYGSQKDSFEQDIAINLESSFHFPGVFIRAPKVEKIYSPEVQIIASHEDKPIFVRYNHILGLTFHPEMTQDLRIHQFFVNLCEKIPQVTLSKD